MLATARLLASCAAMAAALVLTAEGVAFQPPAVRDDIDGVVKLLQQKNVDRAAIAKRVAAIQKRHTLDDLMALYKATTAGGAGYDPAVKRAGDGLQKRINELGTKKELTRDQIQAEKALLLRAAYYNLAMAEIAKAYVPPKPVRGKGAKDWNRHNAEFASGTKEMIDAVKANDPKALKKAMGKIGAGCNGCHTDFRD